jgi:hypothetical protein
MAETKMETKSDVKPGKMETRTTVDGGLLQDMAGQGAALAEGAITATFGVLRDVRVEFHRMLMSTADLALSVNEGALKLVRGVGERADRLAEQALAAGEASALQVVRIGHLASRDFSGLAGRTLSQLADKGEERVAMRAA